MPFTGLPETTLPLLRGLAADNSRTYMDTHGAAYRREILPALRDLVTDLGAELQRRVSDELVADPRVDRSVFRLRRDTRFRPDAAPYHTDLRLIFWEGGPRSSASGLYLRIAPDSIRFAAGMTRLDRSLLPAYREAVADPDTGGELEEVVSRAVAAGAVLAPVDRVRVPSPWTDEHARGDLLRRDGCLVEVVEEVPKILGTRRFVTWCADRMERLSPVHLWHVRHLPALEPA